MEMLPLVAILVAANIVWTGVGIIKRSIGGLMDSALPAEEQDRLRKVIERYASEGVQCHEVASRRAGSGSFVSLHVLVPGAWTVQRGHELLNRLENEMAQALPGALVSTHMESLDDPTSWHGKTAENSVGIGHDRARHLDKISAAEQGAARSGASLNGKRTG